jgi:hypothetical protein
MPFRASRLRLLPEEGSMDRSRFGALHADIQDSLVIGKFYEMMIQEADQFLSPRRK